MSDEVSFKDRSSNYLIHEQEVNALLGDDSRVYTFIGNSTQNISDHVFPEVGNGHVATQIGNDFIFMSGLYSGFEIDSHRAGIPSTVGWHVASENESEDIWEYIFDTARGIFVHRCKTQGVEVQMRTFVMRDVPSIIVREIHAIHLQRPLRLIVKNSPKFESPDLELYFDQFGGTSQMKGINKIKETDDSNSTYVFVVFDDIPTEIVLTPENSSIGFISSINQNVETAWREYSECRAKLNELYGKHVRAWLSLWAEGRITTSSNNEHDLQMAQVIQTTQYFLLTSLPWPDWKFSPTWPFFGLSPGGLAHGMTEDDYMGHVFWDMETWMYPAILPFHPKLAQHMSDYRFYALPKAMEKAKANGWLGAQYPWESAFTGVETSPWNLSANNEQHVIGDISFAICQFLWTKDPRDKQWYLAKGRQVIEEIARFWASRVFYDVKYDRYEIYNVMPPDEYVHCANNSVFTNYVAGFSMQAPAKMALYFNESLGTEYAKWATIADKVFIPLNITEPSFHPEIDGYQLGTVVKQADVILLGYPMQFSMPPWLRRNDLDVYENVTDADGPAMTWSMFAVGRLELKQHPEAWSLFQRSYDYVRDPFKVWTEVRSGEGAVNFATGMGGFLQSVVNGYIGLRIYADSLRLMPVLPPPTANISLFGVKYRGLVFNMTVKRAPEEVVISLVKSEMPNASAEVTTASKKIKLTMTDPVAHVPWVEMIITVPVL